jgi:hypothetical protein
LVKKFALVALLFACAWNFLLTLSAALGVAWVLPRVAGGELSALPGSLRVVYVIFALVSVAVGWLGWQLLVRGGAKTIRLKRYSLGVIVVYTVSTLANILSPSLLERWNAVAAFVVVATTWVLRQPRIEPSRQSA